MKRYVRADAEHFSVKGWVKDPYPYPHDVEYVVIQDIDRNTLWEGDSWDLPDEYYTLNIVDEEYDGAGLCILTVKV